MNLMLAATSPLDRLQTLPQPTSGPRPETGLVTRELLLVSGAVLLVVLILVVWAIYLRKPKRGRTHSPVLMDRDKSQSSSESRHSGRFRRRFRRRRRPHRSRNPTLADTGGLPPARGDDVAPGGL